MATIEQIEDYKQAVLKMLECVSPTVPNSTFHDAINEVIRTRQLLGDIELESLKINWSKK